MKWLLVAMSAIILASFQANFLPFFRIFQTLPDLILIASFFILLYRNFNEAIFFAFWGALFMELSFFAPFNFSSVAVIFTIAVMKIIIDSFEKEGFFPVFILGFIAGILNEFFIVSQLLIVNRIGLVSFGLINYPILAQVRSWLLEMSYNVILIPLIYLLIVYGRKFFGKRS